MEDANRLTKLTAQEAHETQLLDDFFRNADWTSDKQERFNAMREGLFLTPKKSAAYPGLVFPGGRRHAA